MTEKRNNTRIIIISVAAVAVLAAILAGVYFAFGPKGTAGSKTITVQVVTEEVSKDVTIQTDAEMLGTALQEQNLIEGEESEFGMFITMVDGIVADSSKNEYWSITKSGEMLNTGADSTPIADGDHFELTLVTY